MGREKMTIDRSDADGKTVGGGSRNFGSVGQFLSFSFAPLTSTELTTVDSHMLSQTSSPEIESKS